MVGIYNKLVYYTTSEIQFKDMVSERRYNKREKQDLQRRLNTGLAFTYFMVSIHFILFPFLSNNVIYIILIFDQHKQ